MEQELIPFPTQERKAELSPGQRERRTFAIHLTTTAMASGLALGLGVLTGVLTARLLGPTGRGELAALTIWPATIVFLTTMGINQAIVFYLGRNAFTLSQVWTASVVISLVQSVLTILVGLVVLPLAMQHYSHEAQVLCFVVLAASPVIFLGGYPPNILQSQLDLISFSLIQLAAPFLYGLGMVFLVAVHGRGLREVVIWRVLSYVFAFIVGYILLLRRTPLRFDWHSQACFSLLRFGWKTELGNISNYVNRSVDQLVLSLFVPAHDLGLYAVAVTLSLAINFLPQAAGVVALASGSASAADAVAVIARSFRASLVWLLCGSATLFIAAPTLIVGVFGHAYAGSVLACRILLPGTIAIGLNQVLYDGARALGDPALASYSEGFATVVTVGSLCMLLPRLGFLGAAVASTFAYTGSLCVALALYKWRLGVNPSRLFLLPEAVY